jgi:hypothetical protein
MSLYNRFTSLPKEVQEFILTDLSPVSESVLTEQYEDMLNDCYGTVLIGGLEYDHGMALLRVDPIAYACGFADYTDSRDDIIELSGSYFEVNSLDDSLETYLASVESKEV